MPKNPDIRVRLAPSPTGEVHLGTIWTALLNWLVARQRGGAFILRIEDTDQKRLVPGAVDRLYEALAWYGLDVDEGPNHGGQYGPYVQSERLDLYRRQAEALLEEGSVYYCFCSSERLAELRQRQTAAKQPPRYDKRCSAIPLTEARQRLGAGESAVIRLRLPSTGSVSLEDSIRGRVTFRFDQLDDCVLLKSDGWPTYHLAAVVDDHLMCISHVLRGEEWLPSAPKHLFLYRAFGWTPPQFAHLPQILGPSRKKLSKREAAAAALGWRDRGYLPEAMINFLALMGWHPKGDSEVLSRDQLIEQFRLSEVNPSGAIFDQTKLDWLNGHYLRQLSRSGLLEHVAGFWTIPAAASPSTTWKLQALGLVHDRIRTLGQVNELINFVFPSVWDEEVSRQPSGPVPATAQPALDWVGHWLEQQSEPWSAAELKERCLAAIRTAGRKNADVLSPLRQVLTLRQASPDVFDILALLGKAESLRRVNRIRSAGVENPV